MSISIRITGIQAEKASLFNRKDLMCFLVYPFSWKQRSRVLLQTSMAEFMTEMIVHFVSFNADGSSEYQDRVNDEYQVRCCVSLFNLYVSYF